MLGMGRVITSSPTSSHTRSPREFQDCASTPRYGPMISPRYTGWYGLVPMKALVTSVPPESEPSRTVSDTAS